MGLPLVVKGVDPSSDVGLTPARTATSDERHRGPATYVRIRNRLLI